MKMNNKDITLGFLLILDHYVSRTNDLITL
jgi:hypothetical protein